MKLFTVDQIIERFAAFGKPLKPMTTKTLAQEFKKCNKTMHNWISLYDDEIGPRIGHYYTLNQTITIYQMIGLPPWAMKPIPKN